MSFSDEDLKRLKELLSRPSFYDEYDIDLKALLARLEAAEEVCRQVMCGQEMGSWLFDGCIEAWRKAAGRLQ